MRAEAAAKEAAHIAEQSATLLTPEDEAYLSPLLEIYDPPAVLWVRGNTTILNRPGLAVVGTRHLSPYGSGIAEVISRDRTLSGMRIGMLVVEAGEYSGTRIIARCALEQV